MKYYFSLVIFFFFSFLFSTAQPPTNFLIGEYYVENVNSYFGATSSYENFVETKITISEGSTPFERTWEGKFLTSNGLTHQVVLDLNMNQIQLQLIATGLSCGPIDTVQFGPQTSALATTWNTTTDDSDLIINYIEDVTQNCNPPFDASFRLRRVPADKTYVQDFNFEQILINNGYDNVLDHLVDTATVAAITNLDLSSTFLESSIGLEAFTSLETLSLKVGANEFDFSVFQDLTSLQNLTIDTPNLGTENYFSSSLRRLDLSGYFQTSLDLTQLVNLEDFVLFDAYSLDNILLPDSIKDLEIKYSGFTSLDLSGLSNIERVVINNNNNLSFVTFKNITYANLTQLEILNNNNLACIEVDDVNHYISNFPSTISDLSLVKLDCDTISETFIPDDNFEQLLIDLNLDNSLDNYVTTSAIDTLTILDASNKFIRNSKGIEAFIQLEKLDFSNNRMTSIALDQLVNLEELNLDIVFVSELELQNNVNLEILYLNGFQLNSLDLSQSLSLKEVSIINAPIGQLNVDQLSQLESLELSGTNVAAIDLTNNTSLRILKLERGSIFNPDLSNNLQLEELSLFPLDTPGSLPTINFGDLNLLEKLSIRNIPYQNIDLSTNASLLDLSLLQTHINAPDLSMLTSLTNLSLSGDALITVDLMSNVLLERLKINNTLISSIDLSTLTNLSFLDLSENQLNTIDASTNNLITDLIIDGNLLNTLDLSQNDNLEFLSARNNDLVTVDLRNNANELFVDSVRDYGDFRFFNNLNFLNNDNLTCLSVSNLGYVVDNFSQRLPASANFSFNCNQTGTGQISTELEAALVHLQIDDVVDGSITLSAAQDVLDLTLPFGFIINDFSGIEYFASLTNFNAQDYRNSGNGLVLDLTANTRLENISFEPFLTRTDYFDNLPVLKSLSLKVGQTVPININNPSLETLGLYGAANIPSFDFSGSISLRELSMEINRTSAFPDLSNSPDLEYFRFDNGNQTNYISNLDFVNNTQLKVLRLVGIGGNSLDLSANANLEDLTLIGAPVSIQNGRTFDHINFQQNTELKSLTVYNSQISIFDTSNLVNLNNLYIKDLGISSLDLSNNLDLRNLSIESSGMSSIDLTSNSSLTNLTLVDPYTDIEFPLNAGQLRSLEVSESLLTSLPLANFNALTSFKGDNNDLITAINLSQNNRLSRLQASDNDLLDYLNLSNTLLTTRLTGSVLSINDFTNNPLLTCILVEDAAFSNTNLSPYKDAQATFSENCGYPTVSISSSSFEQALVALGIDDIVDGFIDENTAAMITYLDISNLNVTDLNGIEHFANLVTFIATDNQLTTVDLSSNLLLQNINVSNNQITVIDIRNLINIVTLNISNNNVASVLSRSTALIDFSLSGMDDLEELYAHNNPITSIDVSTNINLRVLDLNNTLITSLDLSNNTHLEILTLFSTDLRNLDLRNGNNQLFVPNDLLDVSNQDNWSLNLLNCNNLNCVSVSDVNYMDTNFQINKESFTSFDSNCATAGTEDLQVLEFELLPNSASSYFNINGDLSAVETIRIYSLTGQVLKVIENNFDQKIYVATFSRGTYLVHISLLDKTIVKKLIKF